MANSFKRAYAANLGTATSTIYTTPASNVATIIGLSVGNITTSDINVDVLVGNGTANFYVVKNAPITANAALIVIGGEQKVVLEAGDQLKVKSSASTSMDVVMSFLESTL